MMSHQQLFEPVLTGEPPARDTLDGLVRRSRRRIRYRRLTVAGSGLVAAGVVAVLALPGTAPLMTGAPPPTTAVSAPNRPSPVLLGEEPTEPPSAAVQRLSGAVPVAVHQVVPSARTDVQPTVEREVLPAHTDANPGDEPLTSSYKVTSTVTVGDVTGVLAVTVKRQHLAFGCAAAFPADVLPSTLQSACGPNTDVSQPYTIETKRDELPGMVRHVVWLDRPDGLTIGVSVSNEPALAGAPPLTEDQIVEIARDPGLTLYP